MRFFRSIVEAIVIACLAMSCRQVTFTEVDALPDIFPDYIGVTIPETMVAPVFQMIDGRECKVSQTVEGDVIWVSVSAWRKGEKSGTSYKPFPIYISHDPIDPYIAYRLIEPCYESWHDMGIYQRELASYKEKPIVTNRANNNGCMNCHTFVSGDPEKMVFHARGQGGGTVFINAKPSGTQESVRLINLAQTGPGKQGAYTAWNPDGRHLVFSSNTTHQSFYTSSLQQIEVYDNASDIIMMDLETDEITVPIETEDELETFPAWSPDGKTLYYCSAHDPGNHPFNRSEVRYRLMSMAFEDGHFAEPQTVLDIDSLSVSFPRVKGDKILFTASSFGTFPIWHDEADIWMLDLSDGSVRPVEEINSADTDSYHSWSSNGKWIIFSSRRIDGRYTRLFISHFEDDGTFTKPFLLPQKDPKENQLRLKSYNIPEFVKGEVPDRQDAVAKLFSK